VNTRDQMGKPHEQTTNLAKEDGVFTKVDEPILAGRLKWRPTFEPKMVMKETENYLLHNLESQLWAIGCVEIFSSIWVAY
jgi:hypothetical protein